MLISKLTQEELAAGGMFAITAEANEFTVGDTPLLRFLIALGRDLQNISTSQMIELGKLRGFPTENLEKILYIEPYISTQEGL